MIAGVAGKYCSGKSKAAGILIAKGFLEIDLDRLGHEALERKQDQVIEHFGPSILNGTGKIDRKRLGQLVFRRRHALLELESIVHPEMKKMAAKCIQDHQGKNIVINGALLFYMELHSLCDVVFWVHAPLCVRVRRGMKRDHVGVLKVLQRIYIQRLLTPQHSENDVDIYYVKNRGPEELLEAGIERILAERG